MRDPSWVWRLVFALLAFAGLAIVINAVMASGGNLGAHIHVRGSGEQGTPAVIVISVGIAILATGIGGFFWRRNETL